MIETTLTPKPVCGIDNSSLSSLIIELNIARRNSTAYPKGHQIIDASLQKVLGTYTSLLSTRDEIVLGVACDALIFDHSTMDKSNIIFRDFARVLYERGIGVLIIRQGLTVDELNNFISILGLKREDVYQGGGIEKIWGNYCFSSLDIKAIRYDLFGTTEMDSPGNGDEQVSSEGLWERFAKGLAMETLDPAGSEDFSTEPELMAELLNRQFESGNVQVSGHAEAAIELMRQEIVHQASESCHGVFIHRKLAIFAAKLHPELRRQFLYSAFGNEKFCIESGVESFMRELPSDIIMQILNDIDKEKFSVSPFVRGLLKKFSQHASPEMKNGHVDLESLQVQEKMRTIFREHAIQEFVPDVYRRKLDKIISASQIPKLEQAEISGLMDMPDPDQLESRICDILLVLLSTENADGNENLELIKNLSDITTYFLEIGNYERVLKVTQLFDKDTIPEECRRMLKEHLVRKDFLEEVLNGLETWGKTRFVEISRIIRNIGQPFIEILLERLAGEENMSLRRFMMERLVEFGPDAGSAIAGKLDDNRWYFIRNLVFLVRKMNIISALEKVRQMASHQDPRVRQEAIRTLLHFHDPAVELQISQDLESQDRNVRMTAVRNAEKCTSSAILERLLSLVTRPGLTSDDCEEKIAALQTMAEIGNPDALPVLKKVLTSRSIFHPILLSGLKMEILRSVERYPAHASRTFLETLAAGRGKIAHQAGISLRNILERQ